MAPPLPVYSREEIKSTYPHLFPERLPREGDSAHFELDLENCTLHSITQNQCTFDGDRTVCVPFKRLFARCLDQDYARRKEIIGYKLTPSHSDFRTDSKNKVYRNVEITDWFDNDYTTQSKKQTNESDLLKDFLKADKVLQEKMNQYYERLVKRGDSDERDN